MSGPAPRRSIDNPFRRRLAKAGAPSAIVAGLVVTGLALATVPSPTSATSASVQANPSAAASTSASRITSSAVRGDALELSKAKREDRTNRSTARPKLPAVATSTPDLDLGVVGTRYATTALKVRSAANLDAKVVTSIQFGASVKIADTVRGQWQLINRDGKAAWVRKQYLAKTKSEPKKVTSSAKSSGATSSGGSSASSSGGSSIASGACKSGNAMEAGLTPDAIKVHRALCARFPQVSSFGGVRQGDGGEHGSGRAVDAMISDSAVGQQMADWVRANASALGVSQVIWAQHIWTVQRSSEGWRSMSDRGSATANHYDHVHVTVYGNSAG